MMKYGKNLIVITENAFKSVKLGVFIKILAI